MTELTVRERLGARGLLPVPSAPDSFLALASDAKAVSKAAETEVLRMASTIIEWMEKYPIGAAKSAIDRVRSSVGYLYDAAAEAKLRVSQNRAVQGAHNTLSYVVGGIIHTVEVVGPYLYTAAIVALYVADVWFEMQSGSETDSSEYWQATAQEAASDDVDSYDILGVEPGASKEEIKEAYQERVKEAHPDHGGSAEEFQNVRDAKDDLL